ncbi:MAG: hypothetical protein KDB53_01695 [Planctomycetes bacterium]|nr:hypothetical protein [Planctomycetota bacterium]
MADTTSIIAQAKRVWTNLSGGQKAGVIAITVAVFAGVLFATTMAGDPDYRQLVSGVSGSELETIVARLENDGILDYRIVGDGTLFVESSRLESARRSLAQGGLLNKSNDANEDGGLFGGGALNSRDLAIREARKAEKRLEAILTDTFEFIETAKVSITPGVKSYARSNRRPAKAAVVLKARGGMSRYQIDSVAHTVASAVEDLSADQVAISDTRGIVLRSPDMTAPGDPRAPNLEYQAQLEAQKTMQAQDLMDRSFGPNRVSVKVSVELNWTRQEVKKTEFDPDSSVTVDRMKTEHSKQTPTRVPGGRPSTAAVNNGANSDAGTGNANDKSTTVKETKNFNTVESQVVELGGKIKRMTVSAVVDESLATQVDDIKRVIANAVGLDEPGRGDSIELLSAKMDVPEVADLDSEKDSAESMAKMMQWAEFGLYGLLGLGFLFFSIRTVKKAQANLREVLETSLEPPKEVETPRELTIEEQIIESTKKDSELAGRSLRRWLYEGATEA